MKIQDYTYNEFAKLTEYEQKEYTCYVTYSRNLERKNYIDEQPIDEWEFVQVKDLMELVSANKIAETVLYLINNRKKFSSCIIGRMKAWKVILSFKVVIDTIVEMINVENQTLVAKNTKAEVSEALERVDFSMFGYYPQLLELACGDVLKIDECAKIPYCDAYTFLFYSQKKNEFNEVLQSIYNRKHK